MSFLVRPAWIPLVHLSLPMLSRARHPSDPHFPSYKMGTQSSLPWGYQDPSIKSSASLPWRASEPPVNSPTAGSHSQSVWSSGSWVKSSKDIAKKVNMTLTLPLLRPHLEDRCTEPGVKTGFQHMLPSSSSTPSFPEVKESLLSENNIYLIIHDTINPLARNVLP